jgi:hypothetical protein
MAALLPNMYYDTHAHIYIQQRTVVTGKTQQRAEHQDFWQAGNKRKLNYIVFLLLLIRPNLQTFIYYEK